MNYINHLHTHTESSVLDGMFAVQKWLEKAKEIGSKALAITDHGSMGGTLQLVFQSKQFGIKPIIGIEFYIVNDLTFKGKENRRHLTALATTNKGLQNLITLNNIAQRKGFYRKPRIDYKHLLKYNDDIIITSGCMKGYIPQYILFNKYKKAIEHTKFLKDNFENVFFEIMLFNTHEHKKLNDALIKIGDKYNVKCMITNDSHYLEQDDAKLQNLILKIKTNKKINEKSFQFSILDLWVKSYDELYFMWKNYYKKIFNENVFNELIKNTHKVANLVNDYNLNYDYKFFDVDITQNKDYIEFKNWINGIKTKNNIFFI